MDFKQIITLLNINNILYVFVNVIWIFVTEFMSYRILTDYPLPQKERQKQSAKSDLPRPTGNRRQNKLNQDSQKTNSGSWAILKILPFIISCIILRIVVLH